MPVTASLTMLIPVTALLSSVCVASPMMIELAPPTASSGWMLMPSIWMVNRPDTTTSTQLKMLQRQVASSSVSSSRGSSSGSSVSEHTDCMQGISSALAAR